MWYYLSMPGEDSYLSKARLEERIVKLKRELIHERQEIERQIEEAKSRGSDHQVQTLQWKLDRLPEPFPEELILRNDPEGCKSLGRVHAQLELADFLIEKAEEDCACNPSCVEAMIEAGIEPEIAHAAMENLFTDEDMLDDYIRSRIHTSQRPELSFEDQTSVWIGRRNIGLKWDRLRDPEMKKRGGKARAEKQRGIILESDDF